MARRGVRPARVMLQYKKKMRRILKVPRGFIGPYGEGADLSAGRYREWGGDPRTRMHRTRRCGIGENGRLIFGPQSDHIARRDQHLVPIQLQAGPNYFKILAKDDKLSFGFYARLTSPEGEPLFFPAKP